MSEWNKDSKKMEDELKHASETPTIGLLKNIWSRVRADGDKLQEDYEASQGALGKVFLKLADEQQNLDAIRDKIKKWNKAELDAIEVVLEISEVLGDE